MQAHNRSASAQTRTMKRIISKSKLVLVGPVAAGKTSIWAALARANFDWLFRRVDVTRGVDLGHIPHMAGARVLTVDGEPHESAEAALAFMPSIIIIVIPSDLKNPKGWIAPFFDEVTRKILIDMKFGSDLRKIIAILSKVDMVSEDSLPPILLEISSTIRERMKPLLALNDHQLAILPLSLIETKSFECPGGQYSINILLNHLLSTSRNEPIIHSRTPSQ